MKIKRPHPYVLVLVAVLIFGGYYFYGRSLQENVINYSPEVFQEIAKMRSNDLSGNCDKSVAPLKPWEKQFCLKDKNPCYQKNDGPTPPFPRSDIGGSGCIAPYSKKCQAVAKKFPESYKPCSKDTEEGFLDWSLYNPPISNGFSPQWWNYGSQGGPMPMGANYAYSGLAYQNALDRIYNPLRYPYRSEAFYEQGWYPNMTLPPQVIGCGGRRQGCIGGTESAVPTVPPPIEISERNIAPVNIMTRGPQGIPQQVGLLYKIFGSLNEVYPLYGRKRYPNSDTWDYYTALGENRDLKVPVITRRKNNNELGTNDVVMVEGNSARFRVTIYNHDFPQYVPYA